MTTLSEVKSGTLIRICDDDQDLAQALELYLTLEGWKTALFHDARNFLPNDKASVPGCLVLDVQMPGLTGLQCQQLMKERGLTLPILFITGHGDIDMAVQAVLDGACDFLTKPVDEKRLLAGIEKAATRSFASATGAVTPDAARELLSRLTARETEIVKLIGKGLLSREIAERLGIALRTVEVHRAGALKKLGTHNVETVKKLLLAAGDGK